MHKSFPNILIFLAVLVLILMANLVHGQVIKDGLISYWTFNKSDIENESPCFGFEGSSINN